MSKRRVVVTGMGAVTPIGIGIKEYWEGLIEGKNGVGLITKFDATKFDTKFAAEVKDFNPENYMDKKSIKRIQSLDYRNQKRTICYQERNENNRMGWRKQHY